MRKKTRAAQIFVQLMEKFNASELKEAFPTVRRLQKEYSCGQIVATEVLNQLAEEFHFERIPRGKARQQLHFQTPELIRRYHYATRKTVLAMSQFNVGLWMPVIHEYNRTHKYPVNVRLIHHLPEYTSLLNDASADILQFMDNPVMLGLTSDTLPFLDLSMLSSRLDFSRYYSQTFVHDLGGRFWAIAPWLGFNVIVSNPTIYSLPFRDWDRFEFHDELLQIRRHCGNRIAYPYAFDSYLWYFLSFGLSMSDTLQNRGQKGLEPWRKAAALLQQMFSEKCMPSTCDILTERKDMKLFYSGKLVIKEMPVASIPTAQYYRKYRIMPAPVLKGCRRDACSEFLAVAQTSSNYEHALEFLEYVLSRKIQQMLTMNSCVLPSLRGLRPAFLSDTDFPLFASAVEHSLPFPDRYRLPGYLRYRFETGVDCFLKYGGSIDKILGELAIEYKNHLKEKPNI